MLSPHSFWLKHCDMSEGRAWIERHAPWFVLLIVAVLSAFLSFVMKELPMYSQVEGISGAAIALMMLFVAMDLGLISDERPTEVRLRAHNRLRFWIWMTTVPVCVFTVTAIFYGF